MQPLPQKRLLILTLTVFSIRSTIDQLLETPRFREQPSPQLKCLSSRSRTHQNLVFQRARHVCLLLQTNISSSQETATVGSKKRKRFLTEISMELDLEDAGKTLTAPPRSNINPSTAPLRSNVNPSNSWTCTQLQSQLNTTR